MSMEMILLVETKNKGVVFNKWVYLPRTPVVGETITLHKEGTDPKIFLVQEVHWNAAFYDSRNMWPKESQSHEKTFATLMCTATSPRTTTVG